MPNPIVVFATKKVWKCFNCEVFSCVGVIHYGLFSGGDSVQLIYNPYFKIGMEFAGMVGSGLFGFNSLVGWLFYVCTVKEYMS